MKKIRNIVPCSCIDKLLTSLADKHGMPALIPSVLATSWTVECRECHKTDGKSYDTVEEAIQAWNKFQTNAWINRSLLYPLDKSAVYIYRIEDMDEFEEDIEYLQLCQQSEANLTWVGYTLEQLKSAYVEDSLTTKIVCEYLATTYQVDDNVTLFSKVSALSFRRVEDVSELFRRT